VSTDPFTYPIQVTFDQFTDSTVCNSILEEIEGTDAGIPIPGGIIGCQ
jgi:hypothetical protein